MSTVSMNDVKIAPATPKGSSRVQNTLARATLTAPTATNGPTVSLGTDSNEVPLGQQILQRQQEVQAERDKMLETAYQAWYVAHGLAWRKALKVLLVDKQCPTVQNKITNLGLTNTNVHDVLTRFAKKEGLRWDYVQPRSEFEQCDMSSVWIGL